MLALILAPMFAVVSPMLPEEEVRTHSGRTINLAEWRTHAVIVTFWATWCGPCREDLAALQRLSNLPDSKVRILAVAVDAEGWRTVLPFLRQDRYTLPVALLTPRFRRAFPFRDGLDLLPQTYFFHAGGHLALHVRGALNRDELTRLANAQAGAKAWPARE